MARPPGAPRQALKVEGWKKKHAYIGFVYIPARACDLKSFVLFLTSKDRCCLFVV